jgi:uncharacterized protein (DUF2252 family)
MAALPTSVATRIGYPQQVQTFPVAQRAAFGVGLRKHCPRKSQATWKARRDRIDPVALLIASDRGRIRDLIPMRYGRMAVSAFTFYRGAAAIMASDLAHAPATGVRVQVCGDCHLLNFGGFATPERKLVFDINDFDETAIAPWEWDVKRLTASFVVAGRDNKFDATTCREAAQLAARIYRERMAEYAAAPVMDAWYAAIDLHSLALAGTDAAMRRFDRKKALIAARLNAHTHDLTGPAHKGGNAPKIVDAPPSIFHIENAAIHERYEHAVHDAYREYHASLDPSRRVLLDRFRIADVAMKVVGVGAVGTQCGVALLTSGNGDTLYLQFKEARASVLEQYAAKSEYKHRGQRVVVGQRIMQAASDIFLGWTSGTDGRHLYVRQLHDVKIKPVIETMTPADLHDYAKACGWALARAHARSGDAVMLSAYMGSGEAFDVAMAAFAIAYADQNDRDYAKLLAAIRSGRIKTMPVASGVTPPPPADAAHN